MSHHCALKLNITFVYGQVLQVMRWPQHQQTVQQGSQKKTGLAATPAAASGGGPRGR